MSDTCDIPLDVARTSTAVWNAEQNSVWEHEVILTQRTLFVCLLCTALSLPSLDFLAIVFRVLDLLAANK